MKVSHRIVCLLLLTGIAFCTDAFSQNSNSAARLREKLGDFEKQPNHSSDTAYLSTLIDLAYLYSSGYPDSALLVLAGNAERCREAGYKKGEIDTYIVTGDALVSKGMYEKALQNFEAAYGIAEKSNYQSSFSAILNRAGTVYLNQGNYPEALSHFYKSLKAAEATGNNALAGAALNNIAAVQFYQNMFSEAESTYQRRLTIARNMHDTNSLSHAYNNIGEVNLKQNQPARALQNLNLAYTLASQSDDREMMLNALLSTAEAYYELDSLAKADSLFTKGWNLAKETGQGSLICSALIGLAKVHYKQGALKEALANGLEALQRAETMGQVQLMRDANEIVSGIYQSLNDNGKALTYYKAYKVLSDSMNSLASQRAVTMEKDKYNFSKKESEFERKALQQQWLILSAFIGLILLAAILWMIIRNRNRLTLTNKELQQKNVLVETEKARAEEAFSQLQATQAQLIQSEKMASLGELTAGIAHEIQNPLNFVNNFSEVNKEMIAEMREEIGNGNYEEVKLIADSLEANEEKINHHGKRADAIVKSMLQHSRKNTGQKEPANINALCDEYIQLAYHGLRAKDKSFNAEFTTDLDRSIGKINIVSHDIGRVLLNLLNNAFYAVNEKKKITGEDYKPLVSVQTKKVNRATEISIKDNGNGIPQNIIDKVFQPFFTTKPTGEGTGLGLSLAYDIITKEHSGTIKVESKQGQETLFIITLPG